MLMVSGADIRQYQCMYTAAGDAATATFVMVVLLLSYKW